MAEYTALALLAAAAVVGVELAWLRTGLFTRAAYWLTMLIVFAFQVPVDGWLTKASTPIVLYRESAMSGIRVGWNSPIEDFVFGFTLVTLVLLVWVAQDPRRAAVRSGSDDVANAVTADR